MLWDGRAMKTPPPIPLPGASATGPRGTSPKTEQAAPAGPSFRYLLATAKLESGMRPNAVSRNSTAAGLYQFTQSTWLSMIRDHGAKYGLADMAKAVKTSPDGSVTVEDDDLRGQILALRRDPNIAGQMTTEYAKKNAAYIEARLGRPASDVDLYAAHFFGPAGAVRLLRAVAEDGSGPAADLLKGAARANRAMFYEANGTPKSADTVFATLAKRLHDAGNSFRIAEASGQPLESNALLTAQLSPSESEPA
jgi:Transglycosylase SLT domain